MKRKTLTLFLLLFSAVIYSQKAENPEYLETLLVAYDHEVASDEQPNPIFRWPLPEMDGNVFINVKFTRPESISSAVIDDARTFLDNIFNAHGIYFAYQVEVVKEGDLGFQPEPVNELVLNVVDANNDVGSNLYHNSGHLLLASSVTIGFSEQAEFNVNVGKGISHMLGLLPTYFENSSLNVSGEDASNCGFAGDFVCDTPYDFLGLKNEVSPKSCKYKGDFGEPDPTNLLSRSWSQCMDHISKEQANKIKYNISAIPGLQAKITNQSTIALGHVN